MNQATEQKIREAFQANWTEGCASNFASFRQGYMALLNELEPEKKLVEVIRRINKLDYSGSLWMLDLRRITDEILKEYGDDQMQRL